MNNIKAFPVEYYGREEGMDLRDYFAARAMAQMTWNTGDDDIDAADCYRIADAMIKARNNHE